MYRQRPRLRFPDTLVGDPFEGQVTIEAGGAIRAARLWSDLSQSEAGRRTGIRQQTISAWERGIQEPAFGSVMRLLGACEMDLFVFPFAREANHDFRAARLIIPGRQAVPESAANRQLRRIRENRALIKQYRAEKEGYGRSAARP